MSIEARRAVLSVRSTDRVSVNPLVKLTESGQSIWYDGIERALINSGELTRLIDECEIRGVTSNPTIFEKAIDNSVEYSDQLREQAERQMSASEIYESLAVRDIKWRRTCSRQCLKRPMAQMVS